MAFGALQLRSCHMDAVARAVADHERAAAEYRQAATAWEAQALQAQVDLAECTAQWARAQAAADVMRQAAIEAEARHRNDLEAWRSRPRELACTTALVVMRDACAETVGPF